MFLILTDPDILNAGIRFIARIEEPEVDKELTTDHRVPDVAVRWSRFPFEVIAASFTRATHSHDSIHDAILASIESESHLSTATIALDQTSKAVWGLYSPPSARGKPVDWKGDLGLYLGGHFVKCEIVSDLFYRDTDGTQGALVAVKDGRIVYVDGHPPDEWVDAFARKTVVNVRPDPLRIGGIFVKQV